MNELTGFQRDLLHIIAGEDKPHGLLIKEKAEESYTDVIHHGRLYPNLDTLVKKSLVKKSTKDNRTNAYELTEKGEQTIVERREWENERISHLIN